MRILFFIESLRSGGKERRLVELLKALMATQEIEPLLVLTRPDIHYREVEALGIPIEVVPRWFLKKDPTVFFRFYRVAKKFKPQLIHVWGHMVAFYAVPTKRRLKVPMLNNEITDATPNQKLLGKQWVFNNSEKIIANTQAGLEAYGAPKEKSAVIYNGFNFNRLQALEPKEAIREKFGINTQHVVAMVASFNEYKDYRTYLKAALLCLSARSDVTFLCIGSGDDAAYKIGFSHPNIKFLGRQSGVESIMNICTLGVLATDVSTHAEGISNALLEFMALGKPVVATNSGGSKELITPTTGWLVAPFDAEGLATTILQGINQPAEIAHKGACARERVQQHFSIEAMCKAFLQEYKLLIRKKQ